MAILLSNGKKNCLAMSSELGESYSSIYKYFDDFTHKKKHIKAFLISLVNLYATKENPGIIVTDCTQLLKLYGKKLDVICYDRNNSIKLTTKGMSCVTAAWSNGKVLIPLDFDFWIRKKELKDRQTYKKKTEIAKELIRDLKNKIPHEYAALDGDYANEEFLLFLMQLKMSYSMRMPKNRTVVINGREALLKNQPCFQLKRNERYKTKRGTYKGIPAIFTCHKRKGVNGKHQIVFIISNLENLTPKEHVLAYSCRWPIEKMFRTLKQSLGVQQCQCVSGEKQRAHIFATFLAFTELEMRKIDQKKRSPEQVLKNIRFQKGFKIKPESLLGEGFIM